MAAPRQKQPASGQNGGNPQAHEEPAFPVTGEPEPNRKKEGNACGGEEQSFRGADSLVDILGLKGGCRARVCLIHEVPQNFL